METWQRLSFVLICCVITLVVMQKKQFNAKKVAIYKFYVCTINFSFCCYWIMRDDITIDFYTLIGVVGGSFLPLLWGHWLYSEMFESDGATFRIRYRSFEMIGLLAAVGIFSLLSLEVLGLRT